jgi:hypothetical protein
MKGSPTVARHSFDRSYQGLGRRQISTPPPRMNDHYHLSTLRVRYQARP